MRVAIYARVSTEDQARSGLSIPTQLDNLRDWAKKNGHVVVKEYVDAGVSGKKPVSKRPSLSQFMRDIEAGLGVDALVFTKLDRFFRSVKLYYQATEMMDKRNIGWIAIQERYETISSQGRFTVNLMLSIAEAEADRTSERIKVVFERKVANGEYIGNRVPFGYSVADKHLIPNDDADTVREAFELYRRTGSIYQVKAYLHSRGKTVVYFTVCRLLRNSMYAGRYRDNMSYCEPIISPEVFDEVQKMLEQRSVRENQTKRIYLFSGLLRCADCGKTMVGSWQNLNKGKLRYRCNYHSINGSCPNHLNIREEVIESYLLDNVVAELAKISAEPIQPKRRKTKGPDKAAIMAKVERLQGLYVDGIIDKERFLADREKLLAQLPQEQAKKDLSTVRQIVLANDFSAHYNELSREERRSLWRSVIDHIVVDRDGNLQIYFLA